MRLQHFFENQSVDSAEIAVGIAFGRWNPPHKGHRATWQMAAQNPIWYVGTNESTEGPKDPLPYPVKVRAMTTVWPDLAGHVVAETSWLTLASLVHQKHNQRGNVLLRVYTDESWVIKLLNDYNGKPGGRHGFYQFDQIEHVKTPRLSSATELRKAVASGDRAAFAKASGVSADMQVDSEPFFSLVSKYLKPYIDSGRLREGLLDKFFDGEYNQYLKAAEAYRQLAMDPKYHKINRLSIAARIAQIFGFKRPRAFTDWLRSGKSSVEIELLPEHSVQEAQKSAWDRMSSGLKKQTSGSLKDADAKIHEANKITNEDKKLGLTIFDIDETLMRTTAEIKVVKNGREIRSLTNQEFNSYELKPGEEYDFGEFRNAEKFQKESEPIGPMIAKLKAILKNAGDSKVIMLTARSDFDNKETFLDTFRRLGIDMSRVHVHRAGNLGMAPAESKAVWIRKYLDTGKYGRVRLYDDSMGNIKMFNALSKEYPDVVFYPYLVTHDGRIKTVREYTTETFDTKANWILGYEHGPIKVFATKVEDAYIELTYKEGTNGDLYVSFSRNGSRGVTGEGNQNKIFGAVINHIASYVAQTKPKRLVFDAFKPATGPFGTQDTTRSSLYRKMIQRFASQNGYEFDVKDTGSQDTFILTRKDSKNTNEQWDIISGDLSLEEARKSAWDRMSSGLKKQTGGSLEDADAKIRQAQAELAKLDQRYKEIISRNQKNNETGQ